MKIPDNLLKTECCTDEGIELRIQEAAYYAWINGGCPIGRSIEFWCIAEREVVGATMSDAYDALAECDKELGFNLQNKWKNTSS